MDIPRSTQQQCDSLNSLSLIVTRSFKLPIMRNKKLNVINLLISANIFMISLLPSLSRTFVVDCFKSRYGSFTVISAKPCSNALGQVGTCMFMWDCIKTEGLHLGTCSDRFLFGSCCYHNSTFNDIDIQKSNATLSSILTDSKSSASSTNVNGSIISMNSFTNQPPTTSFLQSVSSSTLEQHTNTNPIIQYTTHSNDTRNSYSQASYQHPEKHNQWYFEAPIINASNYTSQQSSIPSVQQIPAISTSAPITSSSPPSILSTTPSLATSSSSPTTTTTTTTTTTSTTTAPYSVNSPSSNLGVNLTSQLDISTQDSQNPIFRPQTQQTEQPANSAVYQQRPINSNSNLNIEQASPVPNNQPQRPSNGFWFKPATALANAFLHTFRPFSYPSQSRLRPTYRPQITGYKPQYQRPGYASSNQLMNKPFSTTSSTQQQSELTSSSINISSDNSFLNSSTNSNISSSILDTNASNNFSTVKPIQENSDHHIVHPSVPSSSFTNRHRPIDRNTPHSNHHYNGVLELSQPHKQNHYEISSLNNNSQNSFHTNPQNLTSNFNELHNDQQRPITMHQSNPTSTLIVDSLIDHPAPLNMSAILGNMKPVMLHEFPSSSSHSLDTNNNNDMGLVIPSQSNLDQPKPVVLIESGVNGSPNFPSYPIIQAFPTPTNVQNPPVDSHYSTLSSIDEIHGLSTLTNTILPPMEHNQNINHALNHHHHHHQQHQHLDHHHHHHYPSQIQHDNQQLGLSLIDKRPESGENIPAPSMNGGSLDGQMSFPTTVPSISVSTTTPPPIHPTTINTSTSTKAPVTILPFTTTEVPKPFISDSGKRGGNGNVVNREAACGVTAMHPQTKVVGGKNAAFGAWPWQVSVRKSSLFGLASTHRCGGAVISSEWIATAGHCVEDLALQTIRIRVGEYDFSSVSEPFPYIERAARRKVVHPKYNFYTYENDLALVQLDQPIKFPPHVSPICLPPDNIDLLGKNATVTGWGRLNENGILPSILQEVRVPIVSNDKCKDMFLSAGRPEYIPDIFLCAGYEEGGRDSCQGDSGGPLQVKGDDGKWFLAGIISWGIGCAEQNLPGVCTRISRFKLWIQTTMSSSG